MASDALKHARLWSRVAVGQKSACWLWQGAFFENGYGVFNWGRATLRAHRVGYELFYGVAVPVDHVVMHKCDTPACCNPSHLEVGTPDDNVRDRNSKGRQAKGERVNTAKLSEEQVRAIRRDPRQQRVIAAQYGVSKSMIGNIKRGEAWRHAC